LILAFVGVGALGSVVFFISYFGSPEFTDVGYRPEQPVHYSHKLHVGELGMDCRYCHTSVEKSHEAIIPPTETCMNCHSVVDVESEELALVRESWETGKPIEWIRVHMLPDYAYFDHSVHVNAGVGCVSCHGRVDQMEVVMQIEPLSMSWCLDCHRNPGPHIRPLNQVTNMAWVPPEGHDLLVEKYIKDKNISPPEDCTACHR
tara:strand:+ start:495 stop:1103 length:609 start_codon:yes stop_codon:yes gene_type:complete